MLIKVGVRDIPPITFAGLRYTLGFLVLAAWFGLQKKNGKKQGLLRVISAKDYIRLIILGILMYTLTQGAQFIGLKYIPAATANLILSFTSILVALSGLLLLHEHLGLIQWIGLFLSLIGAGIYFLPVDMPGTQWIGLVALTIGLLANACASLLGRSVNRQGDIPTQVITLVSMGTGGILLLGTGLATQGLPPLNWQSWLIVVWLAVVNSAFAFYLWNQTLSVLSAAESSVLNNTMLIQIPIFAWIVLGESLDFKQVIGLATCAAGIFLVQIFKRPTDKPC